MVSERINPPAKATAYFKVRRDSSTSKPNDFAILEQFEGWHDTDVTFCGYFFLVFGVHAGKCNALIVWLLRQLIKYGGDDLVTKYVN